MEKNLDQKTLKKSWLNWVSFGQQCYNYEIMQGLGFASSMIPIINKLYPDDAEARKAALERHLTYYNTENNWGAAVAGIVASMEEEKANMPHNIEPVDDEDEDDDKLIMPKEEDEDE